MSTHLYFDQILVGEISAAEGEFPSFNGEITITTASEDDLFERIKNYIDLCVRQDTFYSARADAPEQEEETDDDEENNALELHMAEEENKFLDLIHSNSWKVKEAGGPEARIYTPLFGMNNTVSWRLNLG